MGHVLWCLRLLLYLSVVEELCSVRFFPDGHLLSLRLILHRKQPDKKAGLHRDYYDNHHSQHLDPSSYL